MNIKAIIFDMDGTIIKSDGAYKKALAQAFTVDQGKLIFDNFESLRSLADDAALIFIKNLLHLTDSEILVAEEKIKHWFWKYLKNTIVFTEGFLGFHAHLVDAGIKTCIATNSCIEDIEAINEALDLKQYFKEHVFSVDHVNGVGKPAPDLFLYALEKLKCNPEDAIVFEDSETGIIAAKTAGIKTVAIGDVSTNSALKKANFVVQDFKNMSLELLHKRLIDYN